MTAPDSCSDPQFDFERDRLRLAERHGDWLVFDDALRAGAALAVAVIRVEPTGVYAYPRVGAFPRLGPFRDVTSAFADVTQRWR